MRELIIIQQSKIAQLFSFLWKVVENPFLAQDKSQIASLLENQASNVATPNLEDLQAMKIKELEMQLFKTAEMLHHSRGFINKPELIKKMDLDEFNKLVDAYMCDWIDDDGNVIPCPYQ